MSDYIGEYYKSYLVGWQEAIAHILVKNLREAEDSDTLQPTWWLP